MKYYLYRTKSVLGNSPWAPGWISKHLSVSCVFLERSPSVFCQMVFQLSKSVSGRAWVVSMLVVKRGFLSCDTRKKAVVVVLKRGAFNRGLWFGKLSIKIIYLSSPGTRQDTVYFMRKVSRNLPHVYL